MKKLPIAISLLIFSCKGKNTVVIDSVGKGNSVTIKQNASTSIVMNSDSTYYKLDENGVLIDSGIVEHIPPSKPDSDLIYEYQTEHLTKRERDSLFSKFNKYK